MKRLIVLCSVALILAAGAAIAGKQQITSTYYRLVGGTSPFYGRTDGIVVGTRAKEIKVVNNGELVADLGTGVYEDFTSEVDDDGLSCRDQQGWGACAGNTTLVPCICEVAETGHRFGWIPIVTADLVPDMDTGSLDIGSEQTDNDGAYLIWGLPGLSGHTFEIGRDPAFHMCTEVAFADATGIDQNIMAGFVYVGSSAGTDDAFNADFEALDAYAGIGVLGTAAAGVTHEDVTIKTETDAAMDGTGDGVTTTDTTDDATEATKYKYCTYVSAAGVVTYTFNGAAPTTTAAFTFVDGIVVAPFMTYLHTADLAGEIDLYTVEIAYDE
jgi:hypothetical protein